MQLDIMCMAAALPARQHNLDSEGIQPHPGTAADAPLYVLRNTMCSGS
jgi:hypothetical protein